MCPATGIYELHLREGRKVKLIAELLPSQQTVTFSNLCSM